LTRPAAAAAMGARAAERARGFDARLAAERVMARYEALVARRRAGARN
jgi:hypothetical protein